MPNIYFVVRVDGKVPDKAGRPDLSRRSDTARGLAFSFIPNLRDDPGVGILIPATDMRAIKKAIASNSNLSVVSKASMSDKSSPCSELPLPGRS